LVTNFDSLLFPMLRGGFGASQLQVACMVCVLYLSSTICHYPQARPGVLSGNPGVLSGNDVIRERLCCRSSVVALRLRGGMEEGTVESQRDRTKAEVVGEGGGEGACPWDVVTGQGRFR